MPSIFSKIIEREIPALIVAEDADFIAFLDINPVAPGHTLVVPKREVDYIFDIESTEYQQFWIFSKKVATGLKKAVPCLRIGISVIGLEVPHAHIHLVPMNVMSDINFSKPKLNPSKSELEEICGRIKSEINL